MCSYSNIKVSLFVFCTILFATTIRATSFFVSSQASVAGTGQLDNPWPLQKALSHPTSLQPGDTVWIRGGQYLNTFDAQTSFNCFTKGTEDKPILFRNYNNERVVLDGQSTYTLYAGLGNCSYTWFWGIEVTNSFSKDRNQTIAGGVTCTAEHIKFINMIIHDTGSGIDCWKTALNAEIYGCIIYHIGNNLNNNGNLEGHGHGLYLQNDTFGQKKIYNNIIFSTYGNGIKIWQTTTTAALGNFDVQQNIVFNGGSASENLGGIGKNSRTHNFFVVSNGVNNPIVNTTIKHNYTFCGTNMPRPPVNAFGLNYGVKNMILDSNYLAGQTRLGFNNTPIFDASFIGNTILGGIPPEYGVYLWGFTSDDFPKNNYIPVDPTTGLDYKVIPNIYENGLAHLVVYNWGLSPTVTIDISKLGLSPGDEYEIRNVMNYFQDIEKGIYNANGKIEISMTQRSFEYPIGSKQTPASQFPKFGAFTIRKSRDAVTLSDDERFRHPKISVVPNPSSGKCIIENVQGCEELYLFNIVGQKIMTIQNVSKQNKFEIDLEGIKKGIYIISSNHNPRQNHYRFLLQ